MKSTIQQTNSLINKGDTLIIKTPLPINPEEIKILGYEVITQDIIDLRDWIGAYYSISSVSKDTLNNPNNLNWKILSKGKEGNIQFDFLNDCSIQKEPYYIYFKFIKLESSGQIINITKVNLKIQDSEYLKQIKEKYPSYFDSIFGDDNLFDSEILAWNYNVLDKISGDSILPHYISKDKDFSIFWGWITHFFAIIVHFGRKFKKIFNWEYYLSFLDEIGLYLKQKGYYQDSRVKINQDLEINLSEEIYSSPIVNTKLQNGELISDNNYYFSGHINVQAGNLVILKVGGIDILNHPKFITNNINGSIIIGYYNRNLEYINGEEISGWKDEEEMLNLEKRFIVPNLDEDRIAYIGISYPRYGINMPLYLRVTIEGRGNYIIRDRSVEDIFGIYSDFRKRGTFKSKDLAKKILEVKKEDGFHFDYLLKNNIGWFLNKNCPISPNLVIPEYIDALSVTNYQKLKNGLYLEYLDQYITLNQNLNLKFKWKSFLSAKNVKIYLDITILDKNGIEIKNAILGNWKKQQGNGAFYCISDFDNKGIVIDVKKESQFDDFNFLEAQLPIEIINNAEEAIFSKDYNSGEDLIEQNLYLIAKKVDDLESYYFKVNRAIITNSNTNSNTIIGENLRLDAIFVNILYSSSTKIIKLKANNNILATSLLEIEQNEIKIVHFVSEDEIDYGFIVLRGTSELINEKEVELSINLIQNQSSIIENIKDLDSSVVLRRLENSLGYLNNSKYFFCYFKNHGIYSESEVKNIIDQKVLPYNGFRLFVENTYYKDKISIPFELISNSWNPKNKQFDFSIRGGIPPYRVMISNVKTGWKINWSFTYNNKFVGNLRDFGTYELELQDKRGTGTLLKYIFTCNDCAELDYKIRAYLDINNNVELYIYLLGGTETSYTIKYGINSMVIPPKNWFRLKNYNILSNINLIVTDNEYPEKTLSINMFELFKNSAVDIYDNGKGNVINN